MVVTEVAMRGHVDARTPVSSVGCGLGCDAERVATTDQCGVMRGVQ